MEPRDHWDENIDVLLAENLNELEMTEKLMAEELKGFYDLMPSETMKEFFKRDLPYTAE
jgi:hypothetical protein